MFLLIRHVSSAACSAGRQGLFDQHGLQVLYLVHEARRL